VYVVERNESFGLETSSRNSQVIHSGIYYPQGSLKGMACITGKAMLYEICKRHGIPHRKLGKLIVAMDDEEVKQLEILLERGMRNGVSDLRMLNCYEIAKLEPNVKAVAALFSPSTGIIDVHALMKHYMARAKDKGSSIVYRSNVTGINRRNGGYQVSVKDGSGVFQFYTKVLINSAGLNSDRIAELAGIDIDRCSYRLHYCKGQYFKTNHDRYRPVNRLIYPVPLTKGSGLGIHTTPTFDGVMLLGPSSHYIDSIEYSVDEQLRDAFYESISRFLPFIECGSLQPEMAGIRPTLQGKGDSFRDFEIRDEWDKGLPGFINLVGIESPGITSSPAIAKYVGGLTEKALMN
jgi:L-2-hydroxyglutarate oxidase LhgO